DAESPASVSSARRARDLEVMKVKEKRGILQLEITQKKVPRKDIMHFSRQMSAFLRAGIPVLDAIEVIEEETSNKIFKKALGDIVQALRAGETFAGAAAAHPEAFPLF